MTAYHSGMAAARRSPVHLPWMSLHLMLAALLLLAQADAHQMNQAAKLNRRLMQGDANRSLQGSS